MTLELEALVEKVARAIAARRMLLVKDPKGEHLPDDLWKQAIPDALAAIRAVAEATQEPPARIKTATGFGIPTTTEDEHWRAMHAASPLGEALRDG